MSRYYVSTPTRPAGSFHALKITAQSIQYVYGTLAIVARDGTWELPLKFPRKPHSGRVARPVERRKHYTDSRSMRVQTRAGLPAHSHRTLAPTQIKNWCGIRRVTSANVESRTETTRGSTKNYPSATHFVGKTGGFVSFRYYQVGFRFRFTVYVYVTLARPETGYGDVAH